MSGTIFKAPAYLDRVTTLKDKSLKVSFVTQEASHELMATLFAQHNHLGHLIFASNEVQEIEIPEDPAALEVESASPSQKVRAHLYVLWDLSGKQGDFAMFYRKEIDKFLTDLKGRINAAK